MTSNPTARHVAVVLNPHAGGGLALREWPHLQQALRDHHITYELIQEDTGDAALTRVQGLAHGTPVMAVGGDGTVGALLPAVIGTGRPLAIVPLGTGNDFAGMLRLKPGAFHEALSRLMFTPRHVDALDVTLTQGDHAGERRVLLNGLGMGFDAQVTLNMTRAPGRLRGFSRYAWAALTTIRELHLNRVEVQLDGRVLYEGPSALVAIMNGTRYGGGFLISPASDAQDGQVNVLASGPLTRRRLAALMLLVLRGRHLHHPAVTHGAGQQVTVRWNAPTPIHLDGDLRGRVQEVQVKVLPGAVTLLNG